jgi:hypothetical protein
MEHRTSFVISRYPHSMNDRAARIARRRANLTGGVASSFAEMDEIDLAQWLSVPPSERLEAVFDMWSEQTREADEAPPRLSRSVGGVRLRRR